MNSDNAARGSGGSSSDKEKLPKKSISVLSTGKKRYDKKHHDPANAKLQPYRFGIHSSAIFERKGTVTKLVQYKNRNIHRDNIVVNKDNVEEVSIGEIFELKWIEKVNQR